MSVGGRGRDVGFSGSEPAQNAPPGAGGEVVGWLVWCGEGWGVRLGRFGVGERGKGEEEGKGRGKKREKEGVKKGKGKGLKKEKGRD